MPTAARAWRLLWLAAGGGAVLTGFARAQVEVRPIGATRHEPPRLPTAEELARVKVEPGFMEIVARLDGPVYEQREAAMQQLHANSFDALQCQRALLFEPLSAEQRHRLLMVLSQRLVESPSGAMGISINLELNLRSPDLIEIERLVPGLPAERVMRVGDRITHLEGERVLNWDSFQSAVQLKKPGDIIDLTVQRMAIGPTGVPLKGPDGVPLYDEVQVRMPLGNFDHLPATNGMPPPSAVRRQREEQARLAIERYSAPPQELTPRGQRSVMH